VIGPDGAFAEIVAFKEIKISLDFFGLVYPELSRRVLHQGNCETHHEFN